ncbi:MAG: hypothetical protein RLZZ271_875 [Pseudomonadota bacterium]|jgi:two-component system osmolarity sensor histidine kinase EnvZ
MKPQADTSIPPPGRPQSIKAALERLNTHSLFWRTFALIAALLLGSQLVLFETFGSVYERASPEKNLERMVDLVERIRDIKSRHPPAATRAQIDVLEREERVRIVPRTRSDEVILPKSDVLLKMVEDHLINALGSGTYVAMQVNGHKGVWLAFAATGEDCWLHMEAAWGSLDLHNWHIFLGIMNLLASITGAVIVARYINRPIRDLKRATHRIEAGDFRGSRLDESVPSPEVRVVNQGFNRMATQLARADEDRVVMLAGISHDLRTPLSRLRLDVELTVQDEQSRNNMIEDLDQMNSIISKFMDYARSPSTTEVRPVSLMDCLQQCYARLNQKDQLEIAHELKPEHKVLADPIELQRVFDNLLENALHYGRSADGRTYIGITVQPAGEYWRIEWRDFGKGVPPALLEKLTEPFFRADQARTHATGAGLGLTITKLALRRMGAEVSLSNAPEGGLVTTIKLRRAT